MNEASPTRSFTDPARQIFHELRAAAATAGGEPRGASCSLQGSPRSSRRRSPVGTAPSSLQPSPVVSRRESTAPLRQQHQVLEETLTPQCTAPRATGSPGQPRRRRISGECPGASPGGSPALSVRSGSSSGEGRGAGTPRGSSEWLAPSGCRQQPPVSRLG